MHINSVQPFESYIKSRGSDGPWDYTSETDLSWWAEQAGSLYVVFVACVECQTSVLSGKRLDIDKCCLSEPLNPKQPTNLFTYVQKCRLILVSVISHAGHEIS